MDIEINMTDAWMINQGLLGMYRILKHSDLSMMITQYGIIVSEETLRELPKAYFDYFFDRYNNAEKIDKRLKYYLNRWKKNNDYKKFITNEISYVLSKRKNGYIKKLNVEEQFNNIDEIKTKIVKYKNYDATAEELINRFIEIISDKSINKNMTYHSNKSKIFQPHFGQVSFLQKSVSTIDEAIYVFNESYINPLLDDKNSKTDWNVTNKCTFFNDEPASDRNFGEGEFGVTMMSQNNINTLWGEGKISQPISNLARLVLLCTPAGGKLNIKNDCPLQACFINTDSSFETLRRLNQEDKNWFNGLDDGIKYGIQYINYESSFKDNITSKLNCNSLLSDRTVNCISISKCTLSKINKLNNDLYNKLLMRIIRGLNITDLMINLISDAIKNRSHIYQLLEVVKLNYIYQKGENNMDNVEEVKQFYKNGYALGQKLKSGFNDNKKKGWMYRIQKVIKNNDKVVFINNLIKLYSQAGMSNSTFMKIIGEEYCDFQTGASWWLSGFMSESNYKTEENK